MSLKVENLANIKSAEINLKPLTIFVGKNNTNKSYLAHVVYMVHKILYESTSFLGIKKISFSDKFVDELFKKYISLDILDIEEQFDRRGKRNSKGYKDIYIQFIQKPEEILKQFLVNIKDSFSKEVRRGFRSKKINNFRIDFNINFNEINLKGIKAPKIKTNVVDKQFLIGFIFRHLMNSLRNKVIFEPFYFPASRTGFVLAFDDIVSGIFRERYGGQATTRLTEPTIDFLSYFARIKTGDFMDIDIYIDEESSAKQEKSIKNLIVFMEENLLIGEIWQDKNTREFLFHPKGTRGRKTIEMHLTSSCVTELLPVYLFLKNFSQISNKLIIIEEPEAHLHPTNQLMMADLITMIVNAGGKVLITTHSDYIVSRINNNIKRFCLSEKEDRNFLDPAKVSAYLFKRAKDKVDVYELPVDKQGISMENFEEVISELLEESSLLDVKLEAEVEQRKGRKNKKRTKENI